MESVWLLGVTIRRILKRMSEAGGAAEADRGRRSERPSRLTNQVTLKTKPGSTCWTWGHIFDREHLTPGVYECRRRECNYRLEVR